MGMVIEIVVARATTSDPTEPLPSQPAFGDLYAQWYDRLVDFCRRTGCGDYDPEELAQEAFLKAWVAWDDFAGEKPFWPWVSKIAERLCVDHWRHSSRVASWEDRESCHRILAPARPDELLEEAEDRSLMGQAFARLLPGHRRIVGMRDIEGRAYQEIAESEGLSVESVRSTLRRARLHLRETYLNALAGSPAVLALGPLRRLRQRIAAFGSHFAPFVEGPLANSIGTALVGLTTVALVLTGGSFAGRVSVDGASRARRQLASLTLTGGAAAGAVRATPASGRPRTGTGSSGADKHGAFGLPIGPAATPEGAYFNDFTESPSFATDHSVFATGFVKQCGTPSCPAIFESTDSGHSWMKLLAAGYVGGSVILPPGYPADKRIFVAGVSALQVSTNSGASFTGLVPIGGPAAISPAFSSGDPRILVGSVPGWQYRDDLGAMIPVNWVGVPSTVSNYSFSPGFPIDPRILVAGTAPGADGNYDSLVSVCRQSTCDRPVVLPGSVGAPRVLTAPSFSTSGLALAWRRDLLYRSTDGAVTFTPVWLPIDVGISQLTFDAKGDLYAALWDLGTNGADRGGLFVSRDEGTTWTALGTGTALAHGVVAVHPLADGHLIASPRATEQGALLCSGDGGETWASRC